MPYGSGLDDILGVAEEVTVGTFVTPATWFEFNEGTIEPNVVKLYSRPRGAGPYQKGSRVRTKMIGGTGKIGVDVVNMGMGKLLKHCFGAAVSAQVDTTTEYTQTFTPGPNLGMGLSVQLGQATTGGVIVPFNGAGGKVTGWELSSDLNDILKLAMDLDFMSIETTTAKGTPSYPSGATPFTFLDGTLAIDGSSAATLKSVKVAGARAMKTDRVSFGGVKREPIQNGESAITGEFASEFESKDAYDAWVSGEQQGDLVLTYIGDTIPAESTAFKLVITIPLLEYTGSAPSDNGDDVHEQTLPFKALVNDDGDPLITAVLHTTDVAI